MEVETVSITDYDYVQPMLGPFADGAVAAGAVSRDEADAWVEEQRRRAADGRLFAAMSHFITSASKR